MLACSFFFLFCVVFFCCFKFFPSVLLCCNCLCTHSARRAVSTAVQRFLPRRFVVIRLGRAAPSLQIRRRGAPLPSVRHAASQRSAAADLRASSPFCQCLCRSARLDTQHLSPPLLQLAAAVDALLAISVLPVDIHIQHHNVTITIHDKITTRQHSRCACMSELTIYVFVNVCSGPGKSRPYAWRGRRDRRRRRPLCCITSS